MDDTKRNTTSEELSTKETAHLKNLEELFAAAPPNQLRQSIHEIYLTYIIQNHEMLPVNFTRIATNIYYLLDFLEKMEKK
jgi:hypothetical protein